MDRIRLEDLLKGQKGSSAGYLLRLRTVAESGCTSRHWKCTWQLQPYEVTLQKFAQDLDSSKNLCLVFSSKLCRKRLYLQFGWLYMRDDIQEDVEIQGCFDR
jgi:hypothetical protein